MNKKVPPKIGRVNDARLISRLGNQMSPALRIVEIGKNGNDEYEKIDAEIGIDPESRFIIYFISEEDIFILDLGGMDAETINHWSEFGVESKDGAGEKEQGFGAKAGMRQACDEAAYLTSFKNGLLNKVGFVKESNGELSVKPKWIDRDNQLKSCQLDENGDSINAMYDIEKEDCYQTLADELKKYGIDLNQRWISGNINQMPHGNISWAYDDFIQTIVDRDGWTLIHIKGTQKNMSLLHDDGSPAKARKRRSALIDPRNGLLAKMKVQPQFRKTLNNSSVFFVYKRDGQYCSWFLQSEKPRTMKGIDSVIIQEEAILKDDFTGTILQTDEKIEMRIYASQVNLNRSNKYEGMAGIEVSDGRNTLWTRDFSRTHQDPSSAAHIFGEIIVPNQELKKIASEGRDHEPRSWQARAIANYIDEKVEPIIKQVSELLKNKNERNINSGQSQKDIEEEMKKMEQLIDLENIWNDSDQTSGRSNDNILAKEIDVIYVESSMRPLKSVNIPVGLKYRMNILAKGTTEEGERKLEQLEGKRGEDRSSYFEIKAEDSKIVEVKENFTLLASKLGSTNVKISSNEKLNGFAETTIKVNVISIEKTPKVSLKPQEEVYQQARPIRILIEGVGKLGDEEVILDHSNTIFEYNIEGPATIEGIIPPKILTTESGGDHGIISVNWSKNNGEIKIPFNTNDEFYIKNNKRGEGKNNPGKRSFPRVIVCGEEPSLTEAEKEIVQHQVTVKPGPGIPTLYEQPDWMEIGIVWLNTHSLEAKADLRRKNSPHLVHEPGTDIYNRFMQRQAVEVALRQVIRVGIERLEYPVTDLDFTSWLLIRQRAQEKLDTVYNAMLNGDYNYENNEPTKISKNSFLSKENIEEE